MNAPASARRPALGQRLVVASHNPGKVREIAELVRPFDLSVITAGALGLDEPEETGASFEENAALKAVAAARASGLPALADDSGLSVEALGGAPGVYSARWAGPDQDFAKAMRKVAVRLDALGATEPESRRASFVAVLCLAFPDGTYELYRGEVEGTLVYPPRGTGGFGYDPIFVPNGYDRTFGELPAAVKAGISHRARAFARFAAARLKS